jgi:hypothetical protein
MKSVLKFESLTIRRIAPSTIRSNIAFFRMLPALVKVWCLPALISSWSWLSVPKLKKVYESLLIWLRLFIRPDERYAKVLKRICPLYSTVFCLSGITELSHKMPDCMSYLIFIPKKADHSVYADRFAGRLPADGIHLTINWFAIFWINFIFTKYEFLLTR